MSHGHDHKEYKRVFGDVQKQSKGLYVLCDGEAPKSGQDVRQQSRGVCLGKPLKACGTCEHSSFTLSFKPGIGNEVVACPTWKSIDAKLEHKPPLYEAVRREQCLLKRPYDYCSSCPNSKVDRPAETKEGWWETKIWKER